MPFLHTTNELASRGTVRSRCGITITLEEVIEGTAYCFFTDPPVDWDFGVGFPPKCPDCATMEALDFEASS